MSRGLPLDVFILDMDWHTKNDWTGYTFDAHLFPNASDSMAWLKHNGRPRDASMAACVLAPPLPAPLPDQFPVSLRLLCVLNGQVCIWASTSTMPTALASGKTLTRPWRA